MRHLPILVLFATTSLAHTACTSRTIPLEIRFATEALSTEATALEVYVIDRCADATLGQAPTSSRSRVSWRRGESSMALAGALPDRFGVLAIARSGTCEVVASGCRDATRSDASVVVPIDAQTGPGCSACTRGLCAGAEDASIDAAAFVDARVDTPADAMPDSPVDAWSLPIDAFNTPESECDCIDQDGDGAVDDGCLAGGGGEVIWQTAFDGPGRQAFRGATLGGDGHVYTNGWMDTGSMTDLCGTTYTGSGAGGTSWTLAVNAATGRCANVFERTNSDGIAPSSTFASPTPGRAGAWIFTPRWAAELVGSTRANSVQLGHTANFNAGWVRIHPSTDGRLLLHFWPSASPTSLAGTAFDSAGADIVAELNAGVVRWIGASPRGTVALWVDATRWAVVSPNTMPASCTMPATPWRVEIHSDPSMPSACTAVFGLDLPNATDDIAVAATPTAIWTLARNTDRSYALVATRLSDGSSASFPLPRAPDRIDTLTHLVAAPDGSVFVGASKGVTGGSPITAFGASEGYVHHLALDASGIRQLGVRRFAQNIVGLGLGAGNVVYVSAGATTWPMCSPGGTTLLTADEGATVVAAIQF